MKHTNLSSKMLDDMKPHLHACSATWTIVLVTSLSLDSGLISLHWIQSVTLLSRSWNNTTSGMENYYSKLMHDISYIYHPYIGELRSLMYCSFRES